MIISASRRTDIPAFYSEWFVNRVKEGYCTNFNPFNRNQVKYISLKAKDVSVIVFWTKNSKPLRQHLNILDDLGLKYYFQYTLNDYPNSIEIHKPSFDILKREFFSLSDQIGADKIIWRYDPIIISNEFNYNFHLDVFEKLAVEVNGSTNRVVISIVDYYKKTLTNLSKYDIEKNLVQEPEKQTGFGIFIKQLVEISRLNGLEIQSCSEPIDLEQYGVMRGKCIDDEYIKRTFDIDVTNKKDPGQRKTCGCVNSIDIGAYDTCLHGCQYCYATKNHDMAKANFKKHDPESPSMVGRYEAAPPAPEFDF
jgi:hypothetical protein